MKLIRLNLSSGEGNQFHIDVEGGQTESSTLPFFTEDSLGLYAIIKIIDSVSLQDLLTEDSLTKEVFLLGREQHRLMIEEKIINKTDNLSTLEHQSIVKKIGEKIFDSLFYGKTKTKLDRELHHEFLHIQICYEYREPENSKIPLYPWHLALFNDEIRNKACFSYLIKQNQPSKNLEVKKKVKLILIASDASDNFDNGEISRQNFGAAINTSIQTYITNKTLKFSEVYQRKEKSSFDTLREHINQNHNSNNIDHGLVINFYGHGIFKKICTTPNCSHPQCDVVETHCSECHKELGNPQGYLLFQKENSNEVEYVSSEKFANIVSLCKPKPILAVITACHSGRSYGSQTVYTGIAQGLISIGVSAVVAFPFRISDESASKFARNFYQSLFLPNSSIFDAFRTGFNACQNEWYRPMLFLREEVNDGKLFSLPSNLNNPRVKPRNSSRGNPEKKTNLHEKDQVLLRNIEFVLEGINEAYKNSCVFSHEILIIYEIFIVSNIFTAEEYKESNHQKLLELYKQRIKDSKQTLNGIFNFERPPSWFQNIHLTPSKKQRKNKYMETTREMTAFFEGELRLSTHKSSWSAHFDDSLGQNYVTIMGYCKQLENFWWNLRQDYMQRELGIKK